MSGSDWLTDLQAHARETFPEECVGYVKDGVYVRLVNRHPEPTKHFRIAVADLYGVNPDVIWHSHPATGQVNPHWPSKADLELFYGNPDVRWGVLATDGVEVGPMVIFDDINPPGLLGREYIWGVYDCYSLIRDWYKSQEIELKNYPRDLQEFQSGKDLYGENFADAGFVEVGLNDLQVGDVLMMSIMSNKINHAALYLGGNEIIHHQINRFSCSDRFDKWERFIVKVVRYAKNT